MKLKVIDPKETTRLEAFELWMNAPNPMVTFFKQIVELIRLQKHYEACMEEINTLEASKSSVPAMVSLTCGLCGCGFIAGSVFAVTAAHPIIWLTVVLAIPGFLLWAAFYFLYKKVKIWRTKKIEPVIEAKYDEMYEVCKKAYGFL